MKRFMLIVLYLAMFNIFCFSPVGATSPTDTQNTQETIELYNGFDKLYTFHSKYKAKSSNNDIVRLEFVSDYKLKICARNKPGKATVTIYNYSTRSTTNIIVVVRNWTFSASNGTAIAVGGTTKFSFKQVSAREFSSTNSKIARVDQCGNVYGKAPGNCKIIFKVGNCWYSTKINVKNADLNTASITCNIGERQKLFLTAGANAKFISTNSSVANITSVNGYTVYVNGCTSGEADIIVQFSDKKLICHVTVHDPGPKVTFGSFIYQDGGNAKAESVSIKADETAVLNIINSRNGVLHYFYLYADGERISSGFTITSSNRKVIDFDRVSEDNFLHSYSYQDGASNITIQYAGFDYHLKVVIKDDARSYYESERRRIYNESGITSNMPSQEIMFLISKWICDNATYDPNVSKKAPNAKAEIGINCSYEDFFRTRIIVCSAYVDLAMYLLEPFDIKFKRVLSISRSHTWLHVDIGGGLANLDITWMDTDIESKYSFQYFLVSDHIMKKYGNHELCDYSSCTNTRFDKCFLEQLNLQNQYLGYNYGYAYPSHSHFSPWITGTWVNY